MIVRMRVVNEDSTINCLQGRKPTFEIDFRRFKRLRYSVSQPPKLCKLPKLPKSNIPMRKCILVIESMGIILLASYKYDINARIRVIGADDKLF